MNRPLLLADLQALVRRLVEDLRQRSESEPAMAEHLSGQHAAARRAGRTGEAPADFSEGLLTQAAVAWVLAAVFVRFLEDNGLLDGRRDGAVRWLAGSGADELAVARDHEADYFRHHPRHGEREYLLHVFRRVAELPAMDELLDPAHNPLWHLTPSADGARDLLERLRRVDPETGQPVHSFESPEGDTRFLGDLYQDLSEWARKRYALLQTPEFVEELILERTLGPAVDELGDGEVTLIDPACGSGHFLLGAFRRLFDLARRRRPGDNPRALAEDVLRRIAGVDVNPFAAAIARFRLLMAALHAAGVERLAAAPDFTLKVVAGDSLLHGRRMGELFEQRDLLGEAQGAFGHYFAAEDPAGLAEVLGRRYHVVVGNPPYITVKDRGLRDLYRSRYPSCRGKYSLVCPFVERCFDLALPASGPSGAGAGHIGLIVANSFMKREFGKELVEEVLPAWDLTHVLDTSGAYIPGHGTPTVILLARARKPVADEIRAVLGIRGEPGTPADPARGKVWSEIVGLLDRLGAEGEYVSVVDVARKQFANHPWSLQGGGAAELRTRLESAATMALDRTTQSIGITCFTLEDELFIQPAGVAERHGVDTARLRPMVEGEPIRDWGIGTCSKAIFPYSAELRPLTTSPDQPWSRFLWRGRTCLSNSRMFGSKTKVQAGLKWHEYGRLTTTKLRTPLSIAFAFVATHNHFVLDRGGKVFNRTAPVIKLPPGASEEEHLELLGLLNSSAACFWMKQVFFCRGSTVDKRGARQTTVPFEDFWEHDATKLRSFPVVEPKPLALATQLDRLASDLQATTPEAVLAREAPSAAGLAAAQARWQEIRARMIALQEELDWQVYRLYGLLEEDLTAAGADLPVPDLALGERAFEIVLARRMAAGEVESTWFERHGAAPITEPPAHWPEGYRHLVERRIHRIESDKSLGLLERPEHKRRWATDRWEKRQKEALRRDLLDRLEAEKLWRGEPRLRSTAQLADAVRRDQAFQAAAALYRGSPDFDLTPLVSELAAAEAVPYLAAWRYKPAGLRKRRRWEEVWHLQRLEDALDARIRRPPDHPDHLSGEEAEERKRREVGDVPVPPRYKSSDYKSSTTWRLRGKLDVPKERFTLYPGAEREADPTPVLGWAGWSHLDRAKALATYYLQMKDREGWPAERLIPLLAGLAELLPWLQQWHNDLDPKTHLRMGDYFASFLDEEARGLGVTVQALAQWQREE